MKAATSGLLLHLSGPLQSWGERSRFAQRETSTAPTRSGLIGLIAAALGRRRDQPLGELTLLQFTVRIDRPGRLMRDFHTVGGGMPRPLTVITADGKRRSSETATLVSERYYLADAAFAVAVTAPDPVLLDTCARALREPRWPPYLGRRSCPPDAPLLLTDLDQDPIKHLIGLPLARERPVGANTVLIEFRADTPLIHDSWADDSGVPDQVYTESQDDPISFSTQNRQYRTRPVYRRHLDLPVDQCAGFGIDYLQRLHAHLHPGQPTESTTPSS